MQWVLNNWLYISSWYLFLFVIEFVNIDAILYLVFDHFYASCLTNVLNG